MISTVAVLAIVVAHFFADFVAQSGYMATKKSSSFTVLCQHALMYGAVFSSVYILFRTLVGMGLGESYFPSALNVVNWLVVNTLIHLCVDYVTSKRNSKLYNLEDKHDFFVGVGLDQLIHYVTLILTYAVMVH